MVFLHRREKNRAIKNQKNYKAQQVKPDQFLKSYQLSSRVMNTDKFNHQAQRMITSHDKRGSLLGAAHEATNASQRARDSYEFKVNGRFQKILKKAETAAKPEQPPANRIKIVDQIQVGADALGRLGIRSGSDDVDTESARHITSKSPHEGAAVLRVQPAEATPSEDANDVKSSVLLHPVSKLTSQQGNPRLLPRRLDTEDQPEAPIRGGVRRLLSTSNGAPESVQSEKGGSLMGQDFARVRGQQRTGVPGPRSRYGVNLENNKP